MRILKGIALGALMLCRQASAGALEHLTFEELDRNGDQRLSSREAHRLQRFGFDFAAADRNRDGYISKAEFDSAARMTLNA